MPVKNLKELDKLLVLDTLASMTDINGDYIIYKMRTGEVVKRFPRSAAERKEIEDAN